MDEQQAKNANANRDAMKKTCAEQLKSADAQTAKKKQ
jgi:hypothetical protein